ncbi:hypothetical protein Dsin_030119 [Dipteronia sinensis]|uniref:Endonuclease/exonuclease/phosphatase domain-containing protein n=1 Tax=Dipteronia sinensis TaxID=43782 RepID=A0AAD9ZJD3_9ROSI|nr:hypothetical protein Dsin_030119 [Dipteronia sinensis]
MKTLAWNVREMGSTRAFQVLLRLKQVFKPSIIFLIEMKVDNVRMVSVCIKLGFDRKLVVDSICQKDGLCLLWTDKTDVQLLSYSMFHIDVKVSVRGRNSWRLTGVYSHLE